MFLLRSPRRSPICLFIYYGNRDVVYTSKELQFKLSVFADDATYFILNERSTQQLATMFSKFEEYSSLKVHADKTEVCGIGSKKGDTQALSGFKVVNLVTDSILILGYDYSSNRKELVVEKNFKAIIENKQIVLSLWLSRGLTVGGKILVFKTLGISQMTLVPKQIIEQLNHNRTGPFLHV